MLRHRNASLSEGKTLRERLQERRLAKIRSARVHRTSESSNTTVSNDSPSYVVLKEKYDFLMEKYEILLERVSHLKRENDSFRVANSKLTVKLENTKRVVSTLVEEYLTDLKAVVMKPENRRGVVLRARNNDETSLDLELSKDKVTDRFATTGLPTVPTDVDTSKDLLNPEVVDEIAENYQRKLRKMRMAEGLKKSERRASLTETISSKREPSTTSANRNNTASSSSNSTKVELSPYVQILNAAQQAQQQ